MKQIDKLIINSPHEEPGHYWHYDREHRTFDKRKGRRPAGYVVATPNSQAFDDPGLFVEIELANKIRPRVKAWQKKGYPGVTDTTLRLHRHWAGSGRTERETVFFSVRWRLLKL